MTKEIRTAWMRIGVAVVLIASTIVVYVTTENAGTEQLVLQGVVGLCGLWQLVQGITTMVTARRR